MFYRKIALDKDCDSIWNHLVFVKHFIPDPVFAQVTRWLVSDSPVFPKGIEPLIWSSLAWEDTNKNMFRHWSCQCRGQKTLKLHKMERWGFFNFLLGFLLLPLEVPTKKDLGAWPASSCGIFLAPPQLILAEIVSRRKSKSAYGPVFSMVFWFNLMKSPFKNCSFPDHISTTTTPGSPWKWTRRAGGGFETTQLQRLKLWARIWLPTVDFTVILCWSNRKQFIIWYIYIQYIVYTYYISMFKGSKGKLVIWGPGGLAYWDHRIRFIEILPLHIYITSKNISKI